MRSEPCVNNQLVTLWPLMSVMVNVVKVWLSKEVVGPSVDGHGSPFVEHTPHNNDVDFSLELVNRWSSVSVRWRWDKLSSTMRSLERMVLNLTRQTWKARYYWRVFPSWLMEALLMAVGHFSWDTAPRVHSWRWQDRVEFASNMIVPWSLTKAMSWLMNLDEGWDDLERESWIRCGCKLREWLSSARLLPWFVTLWSWDECYWDATSQPWDDSETNWEYVTGFVENCLFVNEIQVILECWM